MLAVVYHPLHTTAPMNDTTYSYRLRDAEVISKIQAIAAAQGEKDWRKYARRTFETALKTALGVSCDLTTKEVATELKVHKNTVLRYLRTGVFPHAYWINQRKAMVPYRDVQALRERTV